MMVRAWYGFRLCRKTLTSCRGGGLVGCIHWVVGQWAAVTSLIAAAELPALISGERRAELLITMGFV